MVVKLILVVTALFSIYANVFSFFSPIVIRGVYAGLIMIASLLLYRRNMQKEGKAGFIDRSLIIVVVFCTSVLLLRWERFASGLHDPDLFETIVAVLMIILVLEITRRVIGWALPGLAVFFIIYAIFGNYFPSIFMNKSYSLSRISSFLFWDTTGIFGLPMYIAASYVMLFVIFGAFLLKSGGEKWFINFSYAAVGRLRGGPALTAIISSAFFGMMSGSPVANVVTTGSFTIPLMKNIGYKKHTSAAIEAVASTGGMFTPPIMGAAAFIMAEYLGVPYIEIIIVAIIPAFLFYLSLMITVYLRALKTDIQPLSKDKLPDLIDVIKSYGHLMPPIFVLLWLLLNGWSLMWSAFWSIIILIVLAMLRETTRMNWKDIYGALGEATEKAIPVAIACGSAGIIYGIISLTGLGFRISSLLLTLGGGNPVLVMILTAITGILLGCAMPPTAAYIILASLIVPSLTGIGLQPIVAHMFLFFFCCVGPITPPVALAAYAAAGIADSKPNLTGFVAFRLGMASYIVPFLFAFTPQLLLVGSIEEIILVIVRTVLGIISLAFAIEGFFIKKLDMYLRGIFLLIVFGLFYNSIYFNLVALIIFCITTIMIYLKNKEKNNPITV